MNFPTLKGNFWLEDQPNDVVSGVCTTNERGPIVLLNGVFKQARERKGTLVKLLGITDSSNITIDKCLLSSYGTTQSEYIPNFVFLGEHFDGDKKLEFLEGKIQLRYLKDWIGGGGMWDDSKKSNFDNDIDDIEHKCIQYRIGYSPPNSLLFRQDSTLSFDKVFELSLFLRDFISISVNRPSSVLDLSLIYSSDNRKTEIRVFSKRFAYSCCEQRNIPKNIYPPSKMLYTCEEFGGLFNIEKWVENAFMYEQSLRYLRSYWSNEYAENKLTNMASAFEKFLKIHYGKKEFRKVKLERDLRNCLSSLCDLSSHSLNRCLVKEWSRKIAKNRNTLHNLNDPDYPLLAIMIESVYLLVVINILQNILGDSYIIQRISREKLFPLIESVAASCES